MVFKQFKVCLLREHYFYHGRTTDQHFFRTSVCMWWGSTEPILFKKQKWIGKVGKPVQLSILEKRGPSL